MAKKEVLKPDWNLAKKELEIIGEFTDKSQRFQYRTKKKQNPKQAKKWLYSLETLSSQLNTHLLNRNHSWKKYNLNEKLQHQKNIQNYQDLKKSFKNTEELIKHNKIEKAITKLDLLQQIINYARVREGFSIPKQTEIINEKTVLSDKRT